MIKFILDLFKSYDNYFIFVITHFYFLTIGFIYYGIYMLMLYPLGIYYDVTIYQIQINYALLYIPWIMTPIYAILINIFSCQKILGYLLCIMSVVISGLITIENNYIVVVTCIIIIGFQISFITLIIETKISKLIMKHSYDNSLIIYKNALINIGYIIGGIITSFLVGDNNYYPLYILIFVVNFILFTLYCYEFICNKKFLLKNGVSLCDKNIQEGDYFEIQIIYIFVIVFLLITTSLWIGFSKFFVDQDIVFYVTILLIFANLLTIYFSNRDFFRIVIFILLTTISNPDSSKVLEYYYTTNCSSFNFSFNYYISLICIIGGLSGFFASSIYKMFFKNMKYRYTFFILNILTSVNLLEILLTSSMIYNNIYFIMITFLKNLVNILILIMMMSLFLKYGYNGIESIMYSLLVGYYNMGMMISEYFGIYLYKSFGILTDNENECDLDNLNYLIIIVTILCLLRCIYTYLLPNKKQDEELINVNDTLTIKCDGEFDSYVSEIELNDLASYPV